MCGENDEKLVGMLRPASWQMLRSAQWPELASTKQVFLTNLLDAQLHCVSLTLSARKLQLRHIVSGLLATIVQELIVKISTPQLSSKLCEVHGALS